MQEDTTNSDYPQLSNGTVEFQMMMSEMMSEMKIVIDTTSTDVKYVMDSNGLFAYNLFIFFYFVVCRV